MPRLTSRVFTDLAVWMTGFGVLIGLLFPWFCLLLGLPRAAVLSPPFVAATVSAGIAVGAVNFALARLVVGRRIRGLAAAMTRVEAQLADAVHTRDWSTCDPSECAIAVDSDDEAGTGARAFNRLVATLARSHAVEAARRDLSGVLSREIDLDGLAPAALDAILRHTGAHAGALLVVRDDGLVPLASHALRDAASLAGSDHVRRAMQAGELLRWRPPAAELVIDSLMVGVPAAQALVAPLAFNGATLGAVVVASSGAFAEDAVELVDQFRADLALAIANASAHDSLERLAAVDPLTDAYNRRFGLARLREEYARAVRAEAPLGVLMVDLDRFKSINDRYGHLVGDRALRAVAAGCRGALRDEDVLVRYGGEEFLVVLPGACPEDVLAIGERLRQAIARCAVDGGDRRVGVTVSVGAATYCPGTDTPEALLTLADGALYEAKRRGRNQTVLA